MIRNESEYRFAVAQFTTEAQRIEAQLQSLHAMNLAPEVIERVTASLSAAQQQRAEEIECYTQAKHCERIDLDDLGGLARTIIEMRIAQGISQRELADRLGVSEATLSRSEHREYSGLTLERAARLLEALDVEIKLTVVRKPSAAAAA